MLPAWKEGSMQNPNQLFDVQYDLHGFMHGILQGDLRDQLFSSSMLIQPSS